MIPSLRNYLLLESNVLIQCFLLGHLLPLEEFWNSLAFFSLLALCLCSFLSLLCLYCSPGLGALEDYFLPWFLGLLFCGILPWYQGLLLWYIFLLLWQNLRNWQSQGPRIFWFRPELPLALFQALLPLLGLIFLWNLRWQRLGEDFLPRLVGNLPWMAELLPYVLACLPLLLLLLGSLLARLAGLRRWLLKPLGELVYELHLWGLSFQSYSQVLRRIFWASNHLLNHVLLMEEIESYYTESRPFTASLARVRLKELFLRPQWFYLPLLLGSGLEYLIQGKILIYYPVLFLLALGLLLRSLLYVLWELPWIAHSNLSDWLYGQPEHYRYPQDMRGFLSEALDNPSWHLRPREEEVQAYLDRVPERVPYRGDYYRRVARRVQSRNSFRWDQELMFRGLHGNRRWFCTTTGTKPLHGFLGAALTSSSQVFCLMQKNWRYRDSIQRYLPKSLEPLREKALPANLLEATPAEDPLTLGERNSQWRMSLYFPHLLFARHHLGQPLDYRKEGQKQCDVVLHLHGKKIGLDQKLQGGGFCTLTSSLRCAKLNVAHEWNYLSRRLVHQAPGEERDAMELRLAKLKRLNALVDLADPREYRRLWAECLVEGPLDRIVTFYLPQALDGAQLEESSLVLAWEQIKMLSDWLWELYPLEPPLAEKPGTGLKTRLDDLRQAIQHRARGLVQKHREQYEAQKQARTLLREKEALSPSPRAMFSPQDRTKASYRAALESGSSPSAGLGPNSTELD